MNEELRDYVPRIGLDTITFATGSAGIPVEQIDRLEEIGVALEEAIRDGPGEVVLIEGHTEGIGEEISNLALSDRRAESVAEVLTTFFEFPPENLATQGYGARFLKVPTQAAKQENRRGPVRRLRRCCRATRPRSPARRRAVGGGHSVREQEAAATTQAAAFRATQSLAHMEKLDPGSVPSASHTRDGHRSLFGSYSPNLMTASIWYGGWKRPISADFAQSFVGDLNG